MKTKTKVVVVGGGVVGVSALYHLAKKGCPKYSDSDNEKCATIFEN